MARFALLLITLLALPAAWAADEEPAQPETPAQPEDAEEAPPAEEGTDEEAPAAAGENAEAGGEAAEGQTRRASNDDFIPSQQISEDLSVSFPVDI